MVALGSSLVFATLMGSGIGEDITEVFSMLQVSQKSGVATDCMTPSGNCNQTTAGSTAAGSTPPLAAKSFIAVDSSCRDATHCRYGGGCYQWADDEDFFGNCMQRKSPVPGILMPNPVILPNQDCADLGFEPLTQLANGSPLPGGNSVPDGCYGGAGSRVSFYTTDQQWFWEMAAEGGFNPSVDCGSWQEENPECFDATATGTTTATAGPVIGTGASGSAGPMRPDDAGDDDGDEGGCAANTNVSEIICPGLKTLCVNGYFRSGNVTKDEVDVAVKAVGGDCALAHRGDPALFGTYDPWNMCAVITGPFAQFGVSTIDITMPSFKDTKSTLFNHQWAYGIIDPVSRRFNDTKFDILASFANKDGRLGVFELEKADETMFAEFRKDEAAGKIHGMMNANYAFFTPSLIGAGFLDFFGQPDPDTGLKSLKVSELRDSYSSGKIPEDWVQEKGSVSIWSPTMSKATEFAANRRYNPWPL